MAGIRGNAPKVGGTLRVLKYEEINNYGYSPGLVVAVLYERPEGPFFWQINEVGLIEATNCFFYEPIAQGRAGHERKEHAVKAGKSVLASMLREQAHRLEREARAIK